MTRYAWLTIGLCFVAAAGSVGLASATSAAWSPNGPRVLQLVFVAGPYFFLALLAWRRRAIAARSRLLLVLAVLTASGGLGVFGFDYIRFLNEAANNRTSHSHPFFAPLIQWGAVLAVWIVLAIQEGRKKQEVNKTA
jgi:hypothetical protein